MKSRILLILRRFVAIATVFTAAVMLTGCRPLISDEAEPISIYATFYPIYALTEAAMRDVPDAELHCLVQPQDGCLRAYQLSDWDASLLASGANAVIAGGRGLESFEDTLFGWGESGPAVSAVLYNLELYNQQGGAAADAETESHLKGPNPHLYMSIPGAKQLIESISAALQTLDPQYIERYAENVLAAGKKLDALYDQAKEALSAYSGSPVILMNEALIYVARDYDLEIADWIDRESGASMGDNELAACLERLSTAQASVILIEKQAPQALTEALTAAGYAVTKLDILSTHREGEGFDAYLEIQSGNAQALLKALESASAGKDEH